MALPGWYLRRGRMSRSEWWWRNSVPLLGVGLAAAAVDTARGYPGLRIGAGDPRSVHSWTGGPAEVVGLVLTLVPSVSGTVARLHDRGRSAWWLLWVLVPVLGWGVLLVQCLLPGEPGPNRYGSPPR